ncbi:MAG: DUF2199 domain-containing protein [Burkholderiales bacterium]|nr:DUF2199 domain-containing protein [Burkholderiales bacterium]
MTGFVCSTCGAFHEDMPRLLTVAAPAAWEALPETERASRAVLSADQCVIDDAYFFILGRLELPVLDGGEPFTWMTWVSVSEGNFLRASKLWWTAGREAEPPCFAWVQSSLPYPVPTLNLKADLFTQPLGERPKVRLQEADHPLWREQKHGISPARVQEIVESILHRSP